MQIMRWVWQNMACHPPSLVKNFTHNYGTRQTTHTGADRSQRKNVQGVLLADDRSSRTGFQRPVRENPAAAPATALHEAAGLYLHLVRLGRDGRRHPESRLQKSPELHERRVLGQMVRRVEALRQGRRGAAGAVGFAHPRRGRGQKTRHRPVRRADGDSQRNFDRRDEPGRRNRRAQEEISRRDVHRGHRQFDDGGQAGV